MIDTSAPVLVLGPSRHGSLGVTRSLGRLGVPVYVLDPDGRTPSFFSKHCRGRFVWDIVHAPAGDSVEYVSEIGKQLGRRAVLLPAGDPSALFVAANATALRQRFLFPNLSHQLARTLYNKKEMQSLARSVGVPTPDTFFPASKQEALNFAEEARYPIILKPAEGSLAKNEAARRKVIVTKKQELLDHFEMLEDSEYPNLLFQKYIPGGEHASWMFNGYFDENSECVFGITGRKIRQYRAHAGVTSLGVCQPNETVAETTKYFMKAIGYQGPLDIGYRYDARDGVYKVFDVNPRVGASFRLFTTDNEMDVARVIYLDLTGQPVVPGHGLPGRKWMVEDFDLAASFRYWRDGELNAWEWLRSLRGLRECAFFTLDDPRPMGTIFAHHFCRLVPFLRTRRAAKPVSDGPRVVRPQARVQEPG